MVSTIQYLKCVCARISVPMSVCYTHIYLSCIYQRAWWRDAKLMLFAVALSLNLPGCTRDDPNTRALSSSHYGYVLSASVFSLQVPENVVLREGRQGLVSKRWLASKGSGELLPKYCYTMASSSGDKPIGRRFFDAVSRTFMKCD